MINLNEESSLLLSLCGGFIGYFLGGSDEEKIFIINLTK